MTDSERTFLIEQLEQSKEHTLQSIAGVTPDQWRRKASAESWSAGECAEHIVLSEDHIFSMSQRVLEGPVGPRLAHATEEGDRMIVKMVEDRSHKRSAPEPIVPTGKFETPEDAAREFATRRDKSIAYARSTNHDLRAHAGNGPMGPIDAYHCLLLMSAHSSRHAAQIRAMGA